LQVAADDGRTVWLSLSGEPVFDAGGAFRGYLGAGRHITAQKRAQQLLLLENAVMSCLAGTGGIPFALKGALRAICEGEGWECAELWKVEETGGALRLHQAWGTLDAQGVAAVVEAAGKSGIKRGEGMVGSVWQSGKPLWIRDYLQQAGAERVGDELFEKMGLRAALLVPLRAGPEIVGVLRFGSRAMRAPDERLSDRLSALGGRIGRFVQQAAAEQANSERAARSPRLADVSPDWCWEAAVGGGGESENWDSAGIYGRGGASGALRSQHGGCVNGRGVDGSLGRWGVLWHFGAAWWADLSATSARRRSPWPKAPARAAC